MLFNRISEKYYETAWLNNVSLLKKKKNKVPTLENNFRCIYTKNELFNLRQDMLIEILFVIYNCNNIISIISFIHWRFIYLFILNLGLSWINCCNVYKSSIFFWWRGEDKMMSCPNIKIQNLLNIHIKKFRYTIFISILLFNLKKYV